jgi:hypothetical protein
VLYFSRTKPRKETRPLPSMCKSTAEIRSRGYRFTFLI